MLQIILEFSLLLQVGKKCSSEGKLLAGIIALKWPKSCALFFQHQTLDRFVVSQQQLDPSIVILSAVVIAGRHIRGQSVRLILTVLLLLSTIIQGYIWIISFVFYI